MAADRRQCHAQVQEGGAARPDGAEQATGLRYHQRREDLETTFAAAVACGAHTVLRLAPARQLLRLAPARQLVIRFAYLADPEGNLVELLEPRAELADGHQTSESADRPAR